jgi:PEP-CTERM motif-containing protein
MTTGLKRCAAIALAVLILWPAAARADAFTFTLLPAGGNILGEAGTTIGWGYELTNASATDWLVLTGLNHDPFVDATPDASLFDFPILAPGATQSVAYDGASLLGLFQITWDQLAPAGFVNSGVFVVSAELWDADPLQGGNMLSVAPDRSAAYSATVTAAPTPVPEPGTLLLFGLGAMAVGRRLLVRVPFRRS